MKTTLLSVFHISYFSQFMCGSMCACVLDHRFSRPMFFHVKFYCFLIIPLLACRIRCQEVQEIDDTRVTYRYLSELQSEYFAKLPKWWLTVSEIDGDHATNDFIQTVVNEHREYVFKPSREQLKLNYYRTYLLLDIENFNETISVIYNTLKEDSDFLYDENVPNGNRFNVTQLTVWALSEKTKNLKTNLQTLFDISLQPDVVLKHIQKVCVPFRNNCCCTHLIPFVSVSHVGGQVLRALRPICGVRKSIGARILRQCWCIPLAWLCNAAAVTYFINRGRPWQFATRIAQFSRHPSTTVHKFP